MRAILAGAVLCGAVLGGWSAHGQTHRVTKPENVVRAVGVYEWTGDLTKPTGSRLVPVTLFIEGKLMDAGVYKPQPVPFALLTGNIYDLEDAGLTKGTLELNYAKHTQTAETPYDDGWFGYGSFRVAAPPRHGKTSTLRASKTLPVIVSSGGPKLTNKTDEKAPAADAPSEKSDTKADASADPDRPTMRRRDNSAETTTSDTGGDTAKGSGGDAPDDPDRPTLKRRSSEDAKKQKKQDDVATVTEEGTGTDDPERPNLHRGKPVGGTGGSEPPTMVGLPSEMHQLVAVSDATDREPHPFARPWADDAEKAAVLTKLRAMAQSQLTQYGGAAAPAPPKAASTAKTTTGKTTPRRAVKPVVDPAAGLQEEDLKGYTLSYGGAATYVYSAHTGGLGADMRFVTIVAQDDGLGDLKAALQNVTDAAHLDRTPRMRFVDVVDADASNRASLLFELREQNSRQFGLYRVLATKAELIFLTGTTL